MIFVENVLPIHKKDIVGYSMRILYFTGCKGIQPWNVGGGGGGGGGGGSSHLD